MIRMIAVVGPSGAGKDLLMRAAVLQSPGLRQARRVITRPASADSEDFDSVTEAEFARREASGAFALHWRAHGLGYAIPWAGLRGEGPVLFNCSRRMLAEAKARFPGLSAIHVTAPPGVLALRLAARGREPEADQQARLDRAAVLWPEGLPLIEVMNDGTPDQGLARFMAALQARSG